MIEVFGVRLPDGDDLPAMPQGVVLHWTGGGSKANAVDLGAYHYVVEADGTVRAGVPVAWNMRRLSPADEYAAHAGGWNSYRVGIAAAGMRGYRSRSSPGSAPLTEPQVRRMCELAGYFLALDNLEPLDPRHLCTHREVWTIHGVKGSHNDTKLDIEYLPFRPDLKPESVGPYLRTLTAMSMRPTPPPSLAIPADRPPAADLSGLRLDRIEVPTREHVVEIVRKRGLDPGDVMAGLAVMEDFLRATALPRGTSASGEILREIVGVIADWRAARRAA